MYLRSDRRADRYERQVIFEQLTVNNTSSDPRLTSRTAIRPVARRTCQVNFLGEEKTMGLQSAMTTALTGLQAAETTIDVVGNNVANSNTVGFKESNVLFATQFLQTQSIGSAPSTANGGTNPRQIGLGVTVAEIAPDFTQGTIQVSCESAGPGHPRRWVLHGARSGRRRPTVLHTQRPVQNQCRKRTHFGHRQSRAWLRRQRRVHNRYESRSCR